MTTVARRWFGRGTSNLARQCDPVLHANGIAQGIGLTPEACGLRPLQNHALTCVVAARAPSHSQMIRSIQRSVLSISFRKMPIASLSRWYSAISKSSSLLFLLSSL